MPWVKWIINAEPDPPADWVGQILSPLRPSHSRGRYAAVPLSTSMCGAQRVLCSWAVHPSKAGTPRAVQGKHFGGQFAPGEVSRRSRGSPSLGQNIQFFFWITENRFLTLQSPVPLPRKWRGGEPRGIRRVKPTLLTSPSYKGKMQSLM